MANEDWDIDSYYNPFEPEEQWELKKKFMEAYKHMFDESRLVCLAQVLINIEFLGCRYPSDTMRQVAELSHGVIEEFRERQKTRLKRTFVGAADAASAKVKGRMPAQINTLQDHSASVSIHVDSKIEIETKQVKKGKKKEKKKDEGDEVAQSSSNKETAGTSRGAAGNVGVEKKRKAEVNQRDAADQPSEKRKIIDQPVFTKKYEKKQGSVVTSKEVGSTELPSKKEKKLEKEKASISPIAFQQAADEQPVVQTSTEAPKKKKKKKKKKKPEVNAENAEVEELVVDLTEETGESHVTVYQYNLPDFVLLIRENKSLWKGKRKKLRARAILNCSASINDLKLIETKKQVDGTWHFTLSLGDTPLATSVHSDELESQRLAENAAFNALQKTQYSILVKDLREDDEVVTVGGAGEQDEKLSDKNIGFKLMKMMGWSGGGLGSKQQGMVDPVEQKTVVGRSGLGLKLTKGSFEVDIRRYLTSYSKSDSNRDLVFATDYSNEERKFIHMTARRLGLQSKSHNVMGEDGNLTRQLIVSRPVMKTRSLIQLVRDHISGQQSMEASAFGDKIQIIPPTPSS